MIQGIVTASQGMTPLMQKQDQIANNLANINTTGFKQSGLFTKTFRKYHHDDQLRPFAENTVKNHEVYIDYREGKITKTDAPLDMCLRGQGFFCVMTENGVRFTRNGHFSQDAEGYLVTDAGARVMSKKGYIRLEGEQQMHVTRDGEVMQGSESRGRLRIADFRKPYRMMREGNNCFRPALPDNPPMEPAGCVVEQGYLEGSNVNPIKNMVQMIDAFRTYEACQKALLAQDETLDKSVNQVGRVG